MKTTTKKEDFCDISKMIGRRAGVRLIMRLQIIDGCFRQIHHVFCLFAMSCYCCRFESGILQFHYKRMLLNATLFSNVFLYSECSIWNTNVRKLGITQVMQTMTTLVIWKIRPGQIENYLNCQFSHQILVIKPLYWKVVKNTWP